MKMAYIVSTSIYPTAKAKAVAKKYFEALQKYPVDENLSTTVLPAAVKTTKEGVNVFTVGEIKQGKLEEALKLAANRLAMFNDIDGFESSLDIYFNLEEGLATLGMSMPG
jgi:hypothetical protein